MGCLMTKRPHPTSSSAAFLLELNPYLFKVANVDDTGEEQNHGLLEVKDQELLFHQASTLTVLRNGSCRSNGVANGAARGETGRDLSTPGTENPPPIRWPLKSLRRYGFDADLFSFESGRRCATGPGIYAFRCDRAETLFNLVQDSIIRLGQAEEEEASRRRLLQATNQNSASGFAGFRSRFAGPATSPVVTSHDLSTLFGRRNDLQQQQQRIRFNRSISTPCREGDRNYANDGRSPQSHEYLNQQMNGNDSNNRHSNLYVNRDVDPSSPSADRHTVRYAQLAVPPRTGSESPSAGDGVEDDDYDEERDCFDPDLPSYQACKYINLSKVDASVFEGRHIASVPLRLRQGDVSPSLATAATSTSAASGTAAAAANARMTPVARVTPLRNYVNVNGEERMPAEGHEGLVNYIQLDLDGSCFANNGESSKSAGCPSGDCNAEPLRRGVLKSDSGIQRSPRAAGGSAGDSYATIDLRRTRAISCRAVLAETYDEGSRKTRHNSNIES